MNPEEFEKFCASKQMSSDFKQHFFAYIVYHSGVDITNFDYEKVWNDFLTECAKLV